MGAKLSKKKKGYCLGAGKDGESTDTTEVEQKETETQAGQKDAAEPNGEKTPTDQTLNNGPSEEQKAQAEKNSVEVQSDNTAKDNFNKDQKSKSKPNADQKKVEEPSKEQDQPEHTKSSNAAQQMATEGTKQVKSQPDEKTQTEHNKEKESAAKDEPTQQPKAVAEQESSEPKQSVTEPSAPVPEQKEVEKPIPDPETKVKVEKMEKEQSPVLTIEHVSVHVTKEATDSMKVQEAIPKIVETLVSETALVDPVMEEPANKMVEPEPANKVVEPETTEVPLPETVQTVELVKSESDPAPATQSVESKVSEEPTAPIPEVKTIEPVVTPELAPCVEPKQISEPTQRTESLPEPLPSNEVPDSTPQVEESLKHHETLGNADLVTETVETQAATTESAPSAEKNPDQDATVAEDCPSEQAVDEIQESKALDTISKGQEVKDKEMREVKEVEKVSDKQSEKEDHKDTEEVVLNTSKHENDQVPSEDTTVHHPSGDNVSEDISEHHEMPAEELSKEPSAPLIVDKRGVGNGLPVKEEVKVHLENGCDKGLHELNGQGECREIEVCNE